MVTKRGATERRHRVAPLRTTDADVRRATGGARSTRGRADRCPGSGTLLGDSGEQLANLGLAVAAVTAERADRGQLAGLRPSRDRLRVHPEQGGDFGWSQQRLRLWGAGDHGGSPSSRTDVSASVDAGLPK